MVNCIQDVIILNGGKNSEKHVRSFCKSQQVVSVVMTSRLERVVKVFKRHFPGSSYESEKSRVIFRIQQEACFALCCGTQACPSCAVWDRRFTELLSFRRSERYLKNVSPTAHIFRLWKNYRHYHHHYIYILGLTGCLHSRHDWLFTL